MPGCSARCCGYWSDCWCCCWSCARMRRLMRRPGPKWRPRRRSRPAAPKRDAEKLNRSPTPHPCPPPQERKKRLRDHAATDHALARQAPRAAMTKAPRPERATPRWPLAFPPDRSHRANPPVSGVPTYGSRIAPRRACAVRGCIQATASFPGRRCVPCRRGRRAMARFQKSTAGASVLARAFHSDIVTFAEDRILLRNVSAPDAALTRP